MSREKQNIKSSDWLTRGYSEEELANIKEQALKEAEAELRDKQIEGMARVIAEVQYLGGLEQKVAKLLFEKGYRKQSEGEWKRGDMPTYGGYKCSACGGNTLHYKANYCPNCGAKMKGGE